MTRVSTPDRDSGLEERLRRLYENLGITPATMPAPPPDAKPPPKPFTDCDGDEDREA